MHYVPTRIKPLPPNPILSLVFLYPAECRCPASQRRFALSTSLFFYRNGKVECVIVFVQTSKADGILSCCSHFAKEANLEMGTSQNGCRTVILRSTPGHFCTKGTPYTSGLFVFQVNLCLEVCGFFGIFFFNFHFVASFTSTYEQLSPRGRQKAFLASSSLHNTQPQKP